jgi:flagellar assembly protein FliH
MSDKRAATDGERQPGQGADKARARERATKIISVDALSAYERWELPLVEGVLGNPGVMTAKQVEAIQKQAYDEAYTQGQSDGLKHMQQQAQRFEQLMQALLTPFADLDQQVEQELVKLAVVVARQLVRREIKTDPAAVVAVVREAMGQLPVSAQQINLHLHPEDALLVRTALSLNEEDRRWRIVEDPVLARGDCRILTETSRIDATVEARLTAIIATMLGGERHDDRPNT